jgi:hypothetical protein
MFKNFDVRVFLSVQFVVFVFYFYFLLKMGKNYPICYVACCMILLGWKNKKKINIKKFLNSFSY